MYLFSKLLYWAGVNFQSFQISRMANMAKAPPCMGGCVYLFSSVCGAMDAGRVLYISVNNLSSYVYAQYSYSIF